MTECPAGKSPVRKSWKERYDEGEKPTYSHAENWVKERNGGAVTRKLGDPDGRMGK